MLIPVLPAVDATMHRVAITRMLNEALGAHLGPWEWETWPSEFVETILISQMREDAGS